MGIVSILTNTSAVKPSGRFNQREGPIEVLQEVGKATKQEKNAIKRIDNVSAIYYKASLSPAAYYKTIPAYRRAADTHLAACLWLV